MYKLIALDIDGTILNSQGELTARVADSIARARDRGWLVCLLSGRRPRKMQPLAQTLGITTPLVAFNGAIITDPVSLMPIKTRYLSRAISDPIVLAWEQAHIPFFSYRDTTTGPDVYYSLQPVWPRAASYVKEEGNHMMRLDSVARQSWEPLRLMVMSDKKAALEAERLTAPYVRTGATRTYLSRHYDESWYFEVYPLTSKADGIHFLCSHYGLQPQEVIAVGDNVNDVDMLQQAGLGVAMGNATKEVQTAADVTIGDHDHDGLAHFLDHLMET